MTCGCTGASTGGASAHPTPTARHKPVTTLTVTMSTKLHREPGDEQRRAMADGDAPTHPRTTSDAANQSPCFVHEPRDIRIELENRLAVGANRCDLRGGSLLRYQPAPRIRTRMNYDPCRGNDGVDQLPGLRCKRELGCDEVSGMRVCVADSSPRVLGEAVQVDVHRMERPHAHLADQRDGGRGEHTRALPGRRSWARAGHRHWRRFPVVDLVWRSVLVWSSGPVESPELVESIDRGATSTGASSTSSCSESCSDGRASRSATDVRPSPLRFEPDAQGSDVEAVDSWPRRDCYGRARWLVGGRGRCRGCDTCAAARTDSGGGASDSISACSTHLGAATCCGTDHTAAQTTRKTGSPPHCGRLDADAGNDGRLQRGGRDSRSCPGCFDRIYQVAE